MCAGESKTGQQGVGFIGVPGVVHPVSGEAHCLTTGVQL